MLTVIDYDAGNLRSVETALKYLGAQFVITNDPEIVTNAERIIFPGVGDAGAAMERLRSSGLSEALTRCVADGVPLLGICLGSQIILESSEESDARCLGIIEGKTVAFDQRVGRKVPHMGWNTIDIRRDHPLFARIPDDASFYFVHSYFPQPAKIDDVLSTTDYGEHFPSALGRNNVVATQFHPEKSGEFGLQMLQNFLEWKGST